MARRALGPHWNERTAAERTEFVDLFAELFRRTYLSRIELADREQFLYLDETVEGDSATVRTAIVTKKNRQIPVHYLTRRAEGQWKIYDLTVGGTSLVNNYRDRSPRSLLARPIRIWWDKPGPGGKALGSSARRQCRARGSGRHRLLFQ